MDSNNRKRETEQRHAKGSRNEGKSWDSAHITFIICVDRSSSSLESSCNDDDNMTVLMRGHDWRWWIKIKRMILSRGSCCCCCWCFTEIFNCSRRALSLRDSSSSSFALLLFRMRVKVSWCSLVFLLLHNSGGGSGGCCCFSRDLYRRKKEES